ncbi:hypothetical protein RCTIPTONUS_95 [Rhodobacter phage RcTiptonus]|nr:hypothetical protein RCTIPTONUS_95 [Rhodobacter phage RcTiptonus]
MGIATIRGWRDGTSIVLEGFDPSAHKTKEAAARALHEALCKQAVLAGMSPASEVHIYTPEETEERGYRKCWWVMWEAGPYAWGCSAFINGPWGYCETYFGFDLMFTD